MSEQGVRHGLCGGPGLALGQSKVTSKVKATLKVQGLSRTDSGCGCAGLSTNLSNTSFVLPRAALVQLPHWVLGPQDCNSSGGIFSSCAVGLATTERSASSPPLTLTTAWNRCPHST